jgi:hypothetical protein
MVTVTIRTRPGNSNGCAIAFDPKVEKCMKKNVLNSYYI